MRPDDSRDDKVYAHLLQHGPGYAWQVAPELRMQLKTVQRALAALERDGRATSWWEMTGPGKSQHWYQAVAS